MGDTDVSQREINTTREDGRDEKTGEATQLVKSGSGGKDAEAIPAGNSKGGGERSS